MNWPSNAQPLSLPEGQRTPFWFGALALLVWLFAGAAMFLPFASNTSPWDAVTFRVPGNQGNWWHFLVGLPFFLAVPMIWLRVRALQAKPVLSCAADAAFGLPPAFVSSGLCWCSCRFCCTWLEPV